MRDLRLGMALALAMVVAAGCEKQADAEKPAGGAMATAVVTAAAETRDVPVYIDQIGKTSAPESVTIQPQVPGKIIAVHFTDGATVKKGDLLFEIDPRPYQAALDSAQAALAESKAKLSFSQGEVKRMDEIKTSGAVSITEWEQKVNTVQVNEAQVQAGQAAVETAKLNLEYCSIHSPINGRAGKRLVDPGNVVASGGADGGTKLLTIQSLDPIYADFTVTENQLGTVRKYMADGLLPQQDPQGKLHVLVDIPADARDVMQAMEGIQPTTKPTTRTSAPREGQLTFLDNAVMDGSGTVRVRATLPNADRYFWPGQFVNVRLVLTQQPNAVLVPLSAIQIAQQGSFVYVVKPDSTVEMRQVKAGQKQGDMVVLNSGVAGGEQVVIKGQMLLQPGAKVMVSNPPAGAPTSQAVAVGSK